MLPKHKPAKWLRTLKAKGVDVGEWENYTQGWPKAWKAQDTLHPVLDVLVKTYDKGSPGGRACVGHNLIDVTMRECYPALNDDYEAKLGYLPFKECVLGGPVAATDFEKFFSKPIPSEGLARAVLHLWKTLRDLRQNPLDLPLMRGVVDALVYLNYAAYGPRVAHLKLRVLTRLRDRFSVPNLS
jgi:hypothetical protein